MLIIALCCYKALLRYKFVNQLRFSSPQTARSDEKPPTAKCAYVETTGSAQRGAMPTSSRR